MGLERHKRAFRNQFLGLFIKKPAAQIYFRHFITPFKSVDPRLKLHSMQNTHYLPYLILLGNIFNIRLWEQSLVIDDSFKSEK